MVWPSCTCSPPLPLSAEARLEELPEAPVPPGDVPRRPPPPARVVELVDLLALARVVQAVALCKILLVMTL